MIHVDPHTILAVFRLLGRLFPPPPLEKRTTLTFEELEEKYRRVDRFGNLAGFAFTVVLSAGFFFAGGGIADLYYTFKGRVLYLYRPHWIEFGIWFAAIAFPLSFPLLLLIVRWAMRGNYPEYLAYGGHRLGFHPEKVAWLLFFVFFLPWLPLAVLRLDHYTAFRDDGVAFSPFFSLGSEERHAYSGVRSIYAVARFRTDKGEVIDSPHHAILLSDGILWTTRDRMHSLAGGTEAEMVQFVSTKSGKPVHKVGFAEDSPR